MEFSDFLRTCPKKDGTALSERSVDHYCSGLAVASEDMLREGVISKPLQEMSLFELDLAIALIRANPYFEAKDKKGKRMYSNAIKHYRLYVCSVIGEKNSSEQALKQIKEDAALNTTEREALIKARIGQGDYRDNLIQNISGGASSPGLACQKFLSRVISNRGRHPTIGNASVLTTGFC